jgi:hypothetical protein
MGLGPARLPAVGIPQQSQRFEILGEDPRRATQDRPTDLSRPELPDPIVHLLRACLSVAGRLGNDTSPGLRAFAAACSGSEGDTARGANRTLTRDPGGITSSWGPDRLLSPFIS